MTTQRDGGDGGRDVGEDGDMGFACDVAAAVAGNVY